MPGIASYRFTLARRKSSPERVFALDRTFGDRGFRAIGASGLMSVDRLASLSGNASYRLDMVAEIGER